MCVTQSKYTFIYYCFIPINNALKTLDECEIVNWRVNVGVELNRQKSLSFTTRAEEKQKKFGIFSLINFVENRHNFRDFW